MSRVDFLFRLAVFRLGLSFFELDNVKAKLSLDHIANLTGFQGIGGLLECRVHLTMTKPSEIAAFVFGTIGPKLLRQFGEVFAATSAFENLLSLGAVLFVSVYFRMTRKIRVDFLIGRLHLLL